MMYIYLYLYIWYVILFIFHSSLEPKPYLISLNTYPTGHIVYYEIWINQTNIRHSDRGGNTNLILVPELTGERSQNNSDAREVVKWMCNTLISRRGGRVATAISLSGKNPCSPSHSSSPLLSHVLCRRNIFSFFS